MKKNLQIKIWNLYEDKISIEEFEKWIYENSDEIEESESDELFYDLISFNYKSKYSKIDFFTKFDEIINWKEYEEIRILKILESIIRKDENVGESIIETYELRNDGYSFFEDLGMVNGLNLIIGFNHGMTLWKDIPKSERNKLINNNYQQAKQKAIQVKNWINNGTIVLTGKRGGELYRYIYTDNRNPEEIKNWIELRSTDQQTTKSTKKWWKFWK